MPDLSNTEAPPADLATWLSEIWDEQEKAEATKYRPREGMELAEAQTADDGLILVRWEHGGRPEWMTREAYVSEFTEPAPDRVTLARIAADRQILALHRGPHECRVFKTGSQPAGWLSKGSPAGQWAYVSTKRYEDEPCPTKRLLASPYADRPGYREEWKP